MTELQAIEKKLLLLTTQQRRSVLAFVLAMIEKSDDGGDAIKHPVTAHDD